MTSQFRSTLLSLSIAAAAAVLPVATALAHPPWNPYDNTRFAPITRFGPQVGIEVVTRGLNDPVTGAPIGPTLVSPLKAVAAPGLPKHLFIIDQPGVIWVVHLDTGVRTSFLDITATGPRPEKVITVGVCGPNTFDERGLLGLAFHPNYQSNGLFYTYTSELEIPSPGAPPIPATFPSTVPAGTADHQNVISEWRAVSPANPSMGVTAGRRVLIRGNWPQFNHDGGDLAFGPDGMLYFSMGDGGGADDADGQAFINALPRFPQTTNPPCTITSPIVGHQVNGNAQKLNTHLGKIHRINVNPPFSPGKEYRVPGDNPFVNTPGAVPEIWATGFRNPFRFGFDSKTGKLFAGDVGQNDIEEVDIVVRGGNYGWNCKEGTLFFHINGTADGFASRDRDGTRTDCNQRFIEPIAQYDTHHEGHSVIGGYVCNKCAVVSLRGRYVFGEFARIFKFPGGPHDYGRVLAINANGGHGLRSIRELLVMPSSDLGLAILGMAQDAAGEIYVMGNVSGTPFGNSGVVVRLVDAPDDVKDDKEDKDDD